MRVFKNIFNDVFKKNVTKTVAKMIKTLFVVTAILPIAYYLMPALDVERYFSPANAEIVTSIPENAYAIDNLMVADMHADTLLWNRNIAQRSEQGHADVPRLREAQMGLQIFMSVIEAPRDTQSDSIEQTSDQITPITVLDKWPAKTFTSYKERALFQANKLYKAEKDSQGALKVVLSREDLTELQSWKARRSPLYAILGLEGAHATEFDVANLPDLFAAGYRSMELAHYSDTSFAGSSSGMVKYGLTQKGEALVRAMNDMGMIIDVAHLAPKAIVDVLNLTTKPVFSSHTGIYSTCKKARNLDDYLIKKIAAQGGIIGVGFFVEAICSHDLEALIRAITYVRDLVGAQYVALGSGWDIAPLTITPKQLPLLSQGLLAEGFSEEEVRMVMGGNVLRFFTDNLPKRESYSL